MLSTSAWRYLRRYMAEPEEDETRVDVTPYGVTDLLFARALLDAPGPFAAIWPAAV